MKATFLSAPGLFLGGAILVAVTSTAAVATASASSVDESGAVFAAAAEAGTPSALVVADTEADAEGLIFMREEEKLARDVYLTLGEIWDARIFSNIAESEQRHMDAVLGLLDPYGLNDTRYAETVGRFENQDLQQMYDDLVEMGSASLEAALEAGAIIEETDIVDLEEYLAETTADDITRVYENLLRGSRNHLRAFVSRLEAAGVDRTPYVMSVSDYESILESGTERGTGNGGARSSASDDDQSTGGWARGSQSGGRGPQGAGWGGGGRG